MGTTHLLAGEVDTTLGNVPFLRRIWWWCRYYNPLNLSWRYYSMFAYRFTARSWGMQQLALINHEEHPFMPPLPYILGETVHPLHVRRLEMAGVLSSQGVLTFCAAYQGALAIEYAISTEGIPYLPNTTAPLAMVGLFRVMACKWVASKIQVDAYPYPSNLHAVDDHPQGAGEGVSAIACINLASSSLPSSFQPTSSTLDCTRVELSTWKQANVSSSSLPETRIQDCQMHSQSSSPFIRQVEHYQSNKIIVAGWIGVLLGLLTMSFLPYKVAAAYRLPQRLLQFSMETFYQYIALSEFVFHGYLLYQGPRALANRVLFFDHWAFKAQTLGFFLLLMFMLVVALLDFLKNDFYRSCA
ncbi:hypothetical protein KP509_24G029100 [Ceratopteris richardii]|uniref:Uncharacterized protein n=1 Tax=Ceratopteris richardii TaxID=49495 RepID=A0A8T2RWH9_CERRI|nr:hypothetical protein KP509_24G029100 [Ceratopteris richardii]